MFGSDDNYIRNKMIIYLNYTWLKSHVILRKSKEKNLKDLLKVHLHKSYRSSENLVEIISTMLYSTSHGILL